MSEQESWVERRQRLVRCNVHGLHYDPKLTSGCAKCRKNTKTAGPQFLVFLLALLGIAAVLFRIFGNSAPEPVAQVAAPPPALAEHEGQALVELDPAEYRQPLEALETALFDSSSDLTIQGPGIANAVDQLEAAVRGRREDSPAASAIAALGNAVNRESLTLGELRELRQTWRGVRRRYFGSAPWMHGEVAASDDRAVLGIYRDSSAEVLVLLEDARGTAQTILDPTAENSPAQTRRQWSTFASDMSGRIADLESQLPARPGQGASGELLLAVQRLEQALRGLRTLVTNLTPPDPSGANFTGVENAAEEAKGAFDNLLLG